MGAMMDPIGFHSHKNNDTIKKNGEDMLHNINGETLKTINNN